ncbi:hypothetical protein P7G87_00265 [Enterococcus asini]|uniref:hypothetical protein n=1 Tax=Enterococcus asini TaxID=57732 RepID=UPI0028918CAA|nr:hypothetical protein [Enterococcus asini]MDT2783120.1 hypothetical protein [Enterococcus asini]
MKKSNVLNAILTVAGVGLAITCINLKGQLTATEKALDAAAIPENAVVATLPEKPRYKENVTPFEVTAADFAERYLWKNDDYVLLSDLEYERLFVRIEEQEADLWRLNKDSNGATGAYLDNILEYSGGSLQVSYIKGGAAK